jgi:hypothetical protein
VSTCKSAGTQSENGEAWIARIQALTVKETMSKAHMQVHTNKGSREKQPGPNRAEMGLGRPAWANRPSPLRARFAPPFCPRCLSIYCLCLYRPPHPSPFIREPPTRRRSTRRKPPAAVNPRSRLGDGLGLP